MVWWLKKECDVLKFRHRYHTIASLLICGDPRLRKNLSTIILADNVLLSNDFHGFDVVKNRRGDAFVTVATLVLIPLAIQDSTTCMPKVAGRTSYFITQHDS